MTHRAAAKRYARALLDVSIKEGDPVHAEQELAEAVGLVKSHPLLGQTLANPAVQVAKKRAIVAEVTSRAGWSPIVSKLLLLLAERDRLVLLADLLDAYREQVLDYQQLVRAEVTTAAPLPAERAHALERKLADVTGKTVSLAARVDLGIIGGVVARIGSTVYDGSVRRQLERIRTKLVEAG